MNKLSLQSSSFALFLILLVFTPLAFGTVENWSLLIMEAVTAFSFLLLFMSRYFLKQEKCLEIPGIAPLFLIIAYMLLQMIPLPVNLLQHIAPATYEMYRPLFTPDASPSFVTLSTNPKSTLLMLCTFTAYGLLYVLTLYQLSTPIRLKRTMAAVTILGSLLAIEAILQKLTAGGKIYWFRYTPINAFPVGPWVYSNHFAGFMEMVFPLVTALFLYYRPQNHYDTNFKERLITLFTMPGANRYLLLATGIVLMAVSILISLSRGGIITLCVAFIFFTLFSTRATKDKRTQWAILVVLFVVSMITWLGWQPIIEEFGNIWGADGLNTSGRLPVYLDTVKIIQTYPLFGTGFGTFIHAYPAYRSIPGNVIFDHAHNDYLELLADSGIIGFLLCGWFVSSVLFHTIKKLLQRRDRYSILIASGALTGILAFLFHSTVDFQIYNGANGLYFFFMCGLAVSAVNTRIIYRSASTLLPEKKSRFCLLLPGCISLLLLITSPTVRTGIMKARQKYAPVRSTYINPNISEKKLVQLYDYTADALKHDPLEAFYYFRLATFSSYLKNNNTALKEYQKACLLSPFSGPYIQQFALALPDKMHDRKEELLNQGIEREPLTVDRYLVYSKWLLAQDKKDKAVEILLKGVATIPADIEKFVRHLLDSNFNDSQISEILSTYPYAWHAMGKILEQRKMLDAAEEDYWQAIDLLENHEPKPEYFTRLYSLYLRQKKEHEALKTLRLGIKYLPEYPWFRIQLGDFYYRQGVEYRAIEEYSRALQLDPKNRNLMHKLWQIEHQ